MKTAIRRQTLRLMDRAVIGALLFLVLLLLGIEVARAGEIVPSIGMTRAVDNSGSQASVFGGVALRGSLVPMLKSEIGVAYRSETLAGSDTRVHMWPVTASLWFTGIPTLYAGGGVGWYHTTLAYASGLGLADETSQKFGVHLGGGVTMPLVPALASLDLNGRYVFMESQASQLPPNEFDPDFWSLSAGVAFRF